VAHSRSNGLNRTLSTLIYRVACEVLQQAVEKAARGSVLDVTHSSALGRIGMRGSDERTGALFSYVDLEARGPEVHPFRAIRDLVNGATSAMGSDLSVLYWGLGRPSIAPEKLLRAMLL
jgi:hypothetical protein